MTDWTLDRTGEPATEPLTLAEAKEHLRVTHSEEDDYIESLIPAARSWAETYLNRSLITQTWTLKLDGFPSHNSQITRERRRLYPELSETPVQLFHSPVQSITSIVYIDSAGTSQTWAVSNYNVTLNRMIPIVAPAEGEVYPVTQGDTPETVTVTYVAGYGDSGTDLPEMIQIGIKLMLGNLYCNRELAQDSDTRLSAPLVIGSILGPYRVPTDSLVLQGGS